MSEKCCEWPETPHVGAALIPGARVVLEPYFRGGERIEGTLGTIDKWSRWPILPGTKEGRWYVRLTECGAVHYEFEERQNCGGCGGAHAFEVLSTPAEQGALL